jgi:hypothetical protein
LSQAVFAQRKDRIIIAVADTSTTTTRRLEAELRSLGFEVVLHTYPASTKVETGLIRLARDANALAVVGVSDHGESAEFFVVDLITDKHLVRKIEISNDTRNAADDVIAVGVAELLRASLLEVEIRKTSPSQPVPPVVRSLNAQTTQRIQHRPEASQSGLWLALGGRLDLNVAGNAVLGRAALGWQSGSWFGVEAFGAATILPMRIEHQSGNAKLSTALFGTGITADWQLVARHLSARVAGGMSAGRVEVTGQDVVSPLVAATNGAWVLAPYLHGGPAVNLGVLKVRLDLGILLALNSQTIEFADQTAAVWGRPALMLGIDVEASAVADLEK